MKSATLETVPMESAERPRIADYVQLTRPRLGAMVLFTVAVGYLIGAGPHARVLVLLHTLLGTALTAFGASALNQWMERKTDGFMKRTANRPLPAGRLHAAEAFAFGWLLGIGGTLWLLLALPTPHSAIIAATTLLSYVLIYTPLKRVTVWNTLIGAVPGALPPLIGWCAARGQIDFEGASLFAILFVWQLPHFFAIAWLYRDDYAAGGMRMLPAIDPEGRLTAQVMVGMCVLLIPVSMGPALMQITGQLFLVGSVLLSIYFLVSAMDFRRNRSRENAKFVLKASLYYLGGLMLLLLIDGVLPRQLL